MSLNWKIDDNFYQLQRWICSSGDYFMDVGHLNKVSVTRTCSPNCTSLWRCEISQMNVYSGRMMQLFYFLFLAFSFLWRRYHCVYCAFMCVYVVVLSCEPERLEWFDLGDLMGVIYAPFTCNLNFELNYGYFKGAWEDCMSFTSVKFLCFVEQGNEAFIEDLWGFLKRLKCGAIIQHIIFLSWSL